MTPKIALSYAFVCGTPDLTPDSSLRFGVTILLNPHPTISM
jgi:hypothetical protein